MGLLSTYVKYYTSSTSFAQIKSLYPGHLIVHILYVAVISPCYKLEKYKKLISDYDEQHVLTSGEVIRLS